jgi:DMSO/TMAO reductase YedYZ heme-binding membrane subunit
MLFTGDIILALGLLMTVIYIHLFEVSVQATLIDDYILTIGAVIWAIIHFTAMLKDRK